MDLTDDQLSQMSWDDLILMRKQFPQLQMRLAPFEHRAYAREQVRQNPAMAPIFGLMTPAYQAYKLVTGPGNGTPASFNQLKQGLLGTGEGFMSGLRGLMGS